jgi:tetratricopeptide (TPR) repeat protein
MKAGVPTDLPMIESYILKKFKSKEAFNQAIDRAIVLLSPLSLIYQGRYAEAEIACDEEIRMLNESTSRNSAALIKATINMATVQWRLGHLDSAAEYLSGASDMCSESELNLRADVLHRFGSVLADQGKYSQALDSYEMSLDLKVRYVGSTGHGSVAATYKNMGIVEMELGNFAKALEQYDKALEIELQCYGGGHVNVARTQNNIAMVLEQQGRLDEALEMYDTSLKTKIEALGHNHVTVAATYKNMGVVQKKLGNLPQALELYEKALEIELQCLDGGHVSVADTKLNIGVVYSKLGNQAKRLQLYQEAHSIYLQALGPEHPKTKNIAPFI